MKAVADRVKAVAPKTRLFIALCCYAPNLSGQGDPRGGQRLLIERGVYEAGPDVDIYRVPQFSRDAGLHFNQAGQDRIAAEWARLLRHGVKGNRTLPSTF
jgi:hypothetical protein